MTLAHSRALDMVVVNPPVSCHTLQFDEKLRAAKA
jgi:hypothetical protein